MQIDTINPSVKFESLLVVILWFNSEPASRHIIFSS